MPDKQRGEGAGLEDHVRTGGIQSRGLGDWRPGVGAGEAGGGPCGYPGLSLGMLTQ